MDPIRLNNISIDPVPSLYKFHTIADVLRLDKVHPIISGNKWFKLKRYLDTALIQEKKYIVSFGGAYSNHILAIAATASLHGLQSIGIIRGEEPQIFSPTLIDAANFGMKLFFISREEYKNKIIPKSVSDHIDLNSIYLINEGGYGPIGAYGAAEILHFDNLGDYTHIISAVGTGTTLSGLAYTAKKNQQIIGIPVLKNNLSISDEIKKLMKEMAYNHSFTLIHDYSFGGYAKKNKELIYFMNKWYDENQIPSDFVYTGKLFFAVNDLITKNFFSKDSKILIIHSGGLQGNRSLPEGTLIF